MPKPILLSLAGEGRAVILTSNTVRQGFFRFLDVNQPIARTVHGFNLPQFRSTVRSSTALDRLFRRDDGGYPCPDKNAFKLDPREIYGVERNINRLVIEHGAALVPGESVIHKGHVPRRGSHGSMRKILYVIRYGMVFELKPVRRDVVLQGTERDLMIESRNGRIELVRFWGIVNSRNEKRILAQVSHRLDLRRAWQLPLERFQSRRLFDIGRVVPYEGFCFAERSPLADGRRAARRSGLRTRRRQSWQSPDGSVGTNEDALCEELFPVDSDPRFVPWKRTNVGEEVEWQEELTPDFEPCTQFRSRDYELEDWAAVFPLLFASDP